MDKNKSVWKKWSGQIFLLLGFGILACLLYYMDLSVIVQSFQYLGFKIVLVFLTAILWIISNTLCLATLLNYRVPFRHLLYNQVTGDAYNVITPFAGLGGEPYKVQHLTNWVPINDASEAILRDRLIHSLSGILYTSLTLIVVLVFIPLEQALFVTFTTIGGILTIGAILLIVLILSTAPNQFLGNLLQRMKLVENYRSNPLNRLVFLKALSFKMLGRILNLVEFLAIFILLGIHPDLLELLTISAMLALSGTLLFIVPQGIGVNEAGISGAFNLIGRPIELGLTFGLIRRARVIFWALFGVGLHLAVSLWKQKHNIKKKSKQ